jgi:hypothetical protein
MKNVGFDFLYNFRLKHFSFYEELREIWLKVYICILVKDTLYLSDFNETCIFNNFAKDTKNITFHENPSSGSRVVPCGRTDMTKLIVVFRNFAKKKTLQLNPT